MRSFKALEREREKRRKVGEWEKKMSVSPLFYAYGEKEREKASAAAAAAAAAALRCCCRPWPWKCSLLFLSLSRRTRERNGGETLQRFFIQLQFWRCYASSSSSRVSPAKGKCSTSVFKCLCMQSYIISLPPCKVWFDFAWGEWRSQWQLFSLLRLHDFSFIHECHLTHLSTETGNGDLSFF